MTQDSQTQTEPKIVLLQEIFYICVTLCGDSCQQTT